MKQTDPWNSIPEERRLDFKVIGQPLATLAEAMINKIDREWPRSLADITGSRPLFLLLTYVAVTTYETIKYFCAEKPEDPFRKIGFADAAPPLLRSLVDEIFAVAFIAEDLPTRVQAYYRAGWREAAEHDAAYRARYGDDPAWREWLERNAELLASMKGDSAITDAEAVNLALVDRWPIPSRMKRQCRRPATKEFFEYLDAWFYRELSQASHLSFPGLSHRGGTFLRAKDDPIREGEWRKKRSDAVGTAATLLLAFLTEVTLTIGFDLSDRCAYLWGVLRKYFGIAEELHTVRYEALLEGKGDSG